MLLTLGLASEEILAAGDAVFNLLPPVSAVADQIAAFAYQKLGHRRISLLVVENEFGEENKRAFKAKFQELGGEIMSELSFMLEEGDLRLPLTKLKFDDSESVFVVGYVSHYVTLARQLRELRLNKPILAASTCQSWQVLAAMQGQDLKLYYGHPGQSNSAPYTRLSVAFSKAQPQAPRGIPMLYLGSGYDGINLIARVANLCRGGNRQCLARELSKVSDFVGANGPVNFDEQGNNSTWDQIEIRTVRDGDFVRY